MKIKTYLSICNKCENFSTKMIENLPICLLNLDNIEFQQHEDDEKKEIIIKIDSTKAEAKEILCVVPENCPFILEQMVNSENHEK